MASDTVVATIDRSSIAGNTQMETGTPATDRTRNITRAQFRPRAMLWVSQASEPQVSSATAREPGCSEPAITAESKAKLKTPSVREHHSKRVAKMISWGRLRDATRVSRSATTALGGA